MSERYDIIGDTHGHAAELETLLAKLGFIESDGVYRHPEGRRTIFLGDYIDRGPAIRRVLQIVRTMVEAGTALAIAGNHEVNALRYHAKDAAGLPLRLHTPKNRAQHRATLDQIVIPFPDEWQEWLSWFSGLQLWLDLGGLRAVHAAWDEEAMAVLCNAGRLEGAVLERFSRKDTDDYDSISRLINGPEATLLDDQEVFVKGSRRKEIRVRWWEGRAWENAQDAIYPGDPAVPPLPIIPPKPCGYGASEPPVFFGHYSTTPDQALAAPNLACLDCGIGKGGSLTAYRWDGERQIDASKFLSVSNP